jgi:hypothetical protein
MLQVLRDVMVQGRGWRVSGLQGETSKEELWRRGCVVQKRPAQWFFIEAKWKTGFCTCLWRILFAGSSILNVSALSDCEVGANAENGDAKDGQAAGAGAGSQGGAGVWLNRLTE